MPNPPHQMNNPEVVNINASAPAEEIANIIRRDGGVIVKNFVSHEVINQIQREADPYYSKLGKYEGKLFDPTDPPLR